MPIVDPTFPLPPRLREVGDLISLGFHQKEIGRELGIPEHTVKQHTGRLVQMTGARNAVQLAVWWNCPLFRIGLGLEAA